MADDAIASIIALHQPKRAKTGAQRARAYRPRKPRKAKAAPSPDTESQSSESLIPVDFSSANSAFAELPVTPPPTVRLRAVTPSHRVASILLAAAAFALAGVGITTNGWFARSLGFERQRWMAVPGHWRSCRSRRAGLAVMCSRALAHPPARHLSCRMGRMGDDLCLCGHRRHRLRVGQHHRCHGCAGGARIARRDGGPIGVE